MCSAIKCGGQAEVCHLSLLCNDVQAMDVSPLLKILFVFAGLLALTRLKVHLGVSLLLGGLALCLWAGRGISQTAGDLLHAVSLPELWLLLLITALIFEYGRHMAEERNARVIMNTARSWGGRHGRAVSLMTIPAAIGLVPMPGGALFSAPLVEQTTSGESWDPAWKASVNYWFRHTWEYWWPLFPVVIVTLSIFQLEIWQFILMQLPLSLATLVAGYLILIRPHLTALAHHEKHTTTPSRRGWIIALPLFIVILCTLILPGALQHAAPELTLQTRKLLAMLIGLALGLMIILRDSGPDAHRTLIRTLCDRKVLSLLGTVGGVILFKILLDRAGLLPLAGERLIESGIPLVLVVALLPFIAGLVTGIAIGFAGISFPLLAGLASSPETGLAPASTLMLGFAFGYAGMMLSPVHLCFVLSRGYFSVPIARMYRYIAPCSIVPPATAVVLYLLMTKAGW